MAPQSSFSSQKSRSSRAVGRTQVCATIKTIMIEYSNPALFTDLYQLTMAFGYWKARLHTHQSVFNLFYRKKPFGGGYALACGLQDAIDYLS
ncbi:MAG TPA: hypothetical protein VM821_01055, partial [Abditibacteriaceae bacterium]|nr:hypothetical protein [Abditibacteriaceae bacterium]